MRQESELFNVKPLEETFFFLLNLHTRLSIWAKEILHGPENSFNSANEMVHDKQKTRFL